MNYRRYVQYLPLTDLKDISRWQHPLTVDHRTGWLIAPKFDKGRADVLPSSRKAKSKLFVILAQ